VLDIRLSALLEQRYAFICDHARRAGGAGATGMLPGACFWRDFDTGGCRLGNAWLGAYHAVSNAFWQGPTDSRRVGNLGSAATCCSALDTVKVTRCDEVQWRFLGLSLAATTC